MLVATAMGCTDPLPACGAEGTCEAADERIACLDVCVEPGDLGAPCNPDACELGPGETVCDATLVCFEGTCQPARSAILLPCDDGATAGGACAGEFCAGVDCPRFDEAGGLTFLPDGTEGICVAPGKEGAPCDASWAEWVEQPENKCAVCAPGFDCRPDPNNPGPSRCVRPCDDANDCSCLANELAGGDACEDGTCLIQCTITGQECSTFGDPCCKENLGVSCTEVERPTEDGGSFTESLCCRPDGESCLDDGDCCGTCVGGTCQPCQAIPGQPPIDGRCCPSENDELDLVAREIDGVTICGGTCPMTLAGENCREGDPDPNNPCGASSLPYICDPIKGDECPVDVVGVIPDLGDDCVDPELTDECAGTIRGTPKCEGNELVCDIELSAVCPGAGSLCAPPNDDWCAEPTGGRGQIQCGDDSECAPGFHCFESQMRVDGSLKTVKSRCIQCTGDPAPSCYAPGTSGGCRSGQEESPPPNSTCS